MGISRSFELPHWSSRNPQSQLSERSSAWLLSLERIKFQIELAAMEAVTDPFFTSQAKNSDGNYMLGRLQEHGNRYDRWAARIRERSALDVPVVNYEAWDFIVEGNSLWVWRAIYLVLSDMWIGNSQDRFHQVKARCSTFVQLGRQLCDTACNFDYDDTDKLSEVFNAMDLQLGTLYSFTILYHRKWSGQDPHLEVLWQALLQDRIRDAKKAVHQARPRIIRHPSQRLQDNLGLQTVVCIALLGCIYPLFLAFKNSPSVPGSKNDPDFSLQGVNTILQLAGFLTLLLPIYQETVAKEWIGTWTLTALGSCSAIIAVPLYLTVPTSWSALLSWLASATQLLVVLQVVMVAAFHGQERAKND